MLLRVLLAVDSPPLATRLRRLLEGREVALTVMRGGRPLTDRFPREDVDLVIASLSLLADPPALAVGFVRDLPEQPEMIVIADREDPELRASLLAAGAMALVNQGLPDGALGETLQALVRRCQEEAARRLRESSGDRRSGLDDLVADSATMQRFLSLARRVVATDSSLLILGETGVGKERVARAIHGDGPRSAGPFIAVNCAALPESLLESELFGHEQGAFTGASRARRGYFEIAHGGTLFLDEVGEMPAHVQVKLLRALQERTIQRVGGERPIPVNVRVMAATNRDLEAEVKARRFRDDLYYRLAVVTLTIPPLRERRDDIPRLVQLYLNHFRVHLGRPVHSVSAEAQKALTGHDWPGNVRELINVLERAVLLCPGDEIGLADLPSGLAGPGASHGGRDRERMHALLDDGWIERPLRVVRDEVVQALERRYLSELLTATRGRIDETARRAGINERSLYALMQRHGLHKETFKRPPLRSASATRKT